MSFATSEWLVSRWLCSWATHRGLFGAFLWRGGVECKAVVLMQMRRVGETVIFSRKNYALVSFCCLCRIPYPRVYIIGPLEASFLLASRRRSSGPQGSIGTQTTHGESPCLLRAPHASG